MFKFSLIVKDVRRSVRVVYQHITEHPNAHIKLPSGKFKPVSHVTKCLVYVWYRDKWILVNQGRAHCSTFDQFSRPKGRKISLADAMQNIDRKYRTGFWKAFFIAEQEYHYG